MFYLVLCFYKVIYFLFSTKFHFSFLIHLHNSKVILKQATHGKINLLSVPQVGFTWTFKTSTRSTINLVALSQSALDDIVLKENP